MNAIGWMAALLFQGAMAWGFLDWLNERLGRFAWYRRLDAEDRGPAALIALAAVGYLAFWAYWLNAWIGRPLSVFAMGVGLWRVFRMFRRRGDPRGDPRGDLRVDPRVDPRGDSAAPGGAAWLAAFSLALGVFYLGNLALSKTSRASDGPLDYARARLYAGFAAPDDNQLPYYFAEKLFRNEPSAHLTGDWLTSDRPPLATGLYVLFGVAESQTLYEAASVLMQLLALAAVWHLLWSLGATARDFVYALAALVGSGFFYFNAIYVWPKLLAAAYFLFGLSFFVRWLRSRDDAHLLLSAAATAFAMLSHAGVFFAAPAFAFLAVAALRTTAFKALWRAAWRWAAVALACMLPWFLYQKLYAPPGDRLLKWHLAGVTEPSTRRLGELLAEAYGRQTLAQIVADKLDNVRQLVSPPRAWDLHALREWEFLSPLGSFALLSAAWIVALALAFAKPRARLRPPVWLWLGFVSSLAFWCALTYPRQDILAYASSYAVYLLGVVILALALRAGPRWFAALVLGAQAAYFATAWILWTENGWLSATRWNPGAALCMLLGLVLGARQMRALWRQGEARSLPPALWRPSLTPNAGDGYR